MACRAGNVRLLDPIGANELVPFENDYDIGLLVLPPTSFNYAHALPNKFFEFIQSRLALLVGPAPPMKRIVERYDLGIATSGFTSRAVSDVLKDLSPDEVRRYKQNADRAAFELTAESNIRKLRDIVSELVH